MTVSLSERIQQFYDASSGLWEQVWGEHMHHGYYGLDGQQKRERKQAQVDLIDELLSWAKPNTVLDILDVGCGIGGSSLYLAQKLNARATGITLSPVQARRATERATQAGLQASFQVADALKTPFASNSFDLVWSLESGEHMPDKRLFLQECYRVLKPGGTLMMATWCHRPSSPPNTLKIKEMELLEQIYQVYHLPYVISVPEYEQIARDIQFQDIRTADWSDAVAPFWDDVISSALDPSIIFKILGAGWSTVQGAFALQLMADGYRQGLIRYGLLRATK